MSVPWHKRLGRNAVVQSMAGNLLAGYLWLVHRTARRSSSSIARAQDALATHLPGIFTFWHGEHFMVALAPSADWNVHVMISRSADGTINAIAAERLGVATVRGAGDPKNRGRQKGGARAFLQFVQLLEDGKSVAMTADVPKVARTVSPGLIRLARKTGRPIIPSVYVTHPHLTLSSWDRAAIPLPFSKASIGTADPIYVSDSEPDDGPWCDRVKDALDQLETAAYAAIGGRSAFARPQRGSLQHG